MSDLADFLLARIAEDERRADRSLQVDVDGAALVRIGSPDNPPILIVTPARVLAECEAKRRIVELAEDASSLDLGVDLDRRVGTRDAAAEPYLGDLILRALALPYADRPGYRKEWRP